jgi:uncharacterized tellurite resistance protein B-like protein
LKPSRAKPSNTSIIKRAVTPACFLPLYLRRVWGSFKNYRFDLFWSMDVLRSVLKNLFGDKAAEEDVLDTRLAAIALLVHMIAIDGEVSSEESTKLQRLVQAEYQVDEASAQKLIEKAQAKDAEAVDLYGFTSVLKRELPEEERVHLVELLWRMVYADGDVHEFEDNLVWRVSELLAVDPKDRIAMKQKVRSEMVMASADVSDTNGGE